MDIMVEGPRVAQVAGMLHEKDIPYSVVIGDVDIILEREHGTALSKPTKGGSANYCKNFQNNIRNNF